MNKLAIALLTVFAIGGCETSTPPSSPPPIDTTVVSFQDVRADSAAGWLYYSCEKGALVPAGDSATTSWDVRLPYIQCCGKTKFIPVQLNSGPNGPGSVAGAIATGRFDNVASLPDGVVLRTDDATNPVVPLPVLGPNIYFVYDIATHTLRPVPDKVLIIKSSSGKVYKFQITSIYKNAESNPTQETPIGFYHFRSAQIAN